MKKNKDVKQLDITRIVKPISDKELDSLIRSYSPLYLEATANVANFISNNAWIFKDINKSIFSTMEVARSIQNTIVAVREVQTQIISSATTLSAVAKVSVDSITMIQNMWNANREVFEIMAGLVITLPDMSFVKNINVNQDFIFNVDRFEHYKDNQDEYSLTTTTTRTMNIGVVQFKTIQQTNMLVLSLQDDVRDLKSHVYEDSKRKDDMLNELLDYYKNGGSGIVKIKEVRFNKKFTELYIDNKLVKIRADSNQQQLCSVLFRTKENAMKVWEIDQVVKAFGEYVEDDMSEWIVKITSTIRHLNEKIQQETGIEKFILYDNKTVFVNPKYASLLK